MKKIFIANRGEIARRIGITAKHMDIQTVCLLKDDLPPEYLNQIISEFIVVKGESTAHYLDLDFMIACALKRNCDAIHPGFGFLSENAQFARACRKAGLIWIGPNPESIDAMASKSAARQLAASVSVPTVPGLSGFRVDSEDEEENKASLKSLENFSKQHGFPILLKAAFGGGGKGMRIVRSVEELQSSAQRAASEAKNSFGDSLLIAERYLERSRHVEVQVLADQHGQVKIFGDRDCSLQRRHQKILEEAPAINLLESLRSAMHSSAEKLTRAVKYDNAGTVEFIVEVNADSDPVKFYFLEMNTRLQVEHCVTEEIFGVDLVEQQIKIASGDKLSADTMMATERGHSVEVRIYAENVRENFLPAAGPVLRFEPKYEAGVRWEIGIDSVDEITPNFDPMIAKLVITDSTREKALKKLAGILKNSIFLGTESNFLFLQWLSVHQRVLLKPTDTHFIAQNLEHFKVFEERLAEKLKLSFQHAAAFLNASGFLISAETQLQTTTQQAFSKKLHYDPAENSQTRFFQFGDQHSFFKKNPVHSGVLFDSEENRTIYFAKSQFDGKELLWLSSEGFSQQIERSANDLNNITGSGSSEKKITAPVPGKIIAVKVGAGDHVRSGQTLFVLESMKMEFEIKSTGDGTVKSINATLGMIVTGGSLLLEWEL